MKYDFCKLDGLCKIYGNAFYLLDSEQFQKNYIELKKAFTDIYSNFNIAYSYKTNYIPQFCEIVDELGGYAEVVSEMEMELALRIGVSPEKIIWNGPYKNEKKMCELLLMGGTVNIDSTYEIAIIQELAQKFQKKQINIGIRCNFKINDGVLSRFGFDVESNEFQNALNLVKNNNNIHLIGLQCHFASRSLDTWRPRAIGMLKLIEELQVYPEHIDLGGGLFGKMDITLKKQFDSYIPSYKEYAGEVATVFSEYFNKKDYKPLLLIEPGSALVGDCMKFVSRVVNIKSVRGKTIATLLGSIYNINPTLNKKNPPLQILTPSRDEKMYEDVDFGGFTCIESDYLYRHYCGNLAVGDLVVFSNVGSYSIVLKPPFILPNFPVLDICSGNIKVIKRKEYFDDLFHTYSI